MLEGIKMNFLKVFKVIVFIFFTSGWMIGISSAKVYFNFDGENGYQYMGSGNAHPGGGYFSYMGGKVTGPEDTLTNPCSNRDTNKYHYTFLTNENAAKGSVDGSQFALKTPYEGHCNDESFSRDTTIINFGKTLNEFYIRWYQKFTGNWMNGSTQHKLIKWNGPYETGPRFRGDKKNFGFYMRNNGKWPNAYDGGVFVYATKNAAGCSYSGCNRVADYINNRFDNGNDSELYFQTDRWYCIEIHFKANTPGVADGVMELFIDGKLYIGVYESYFGSNINNPSGVSNIEMQHIYYTRDTNDDQPTYMDNILISDKYIGPFGSANPQENPSEEISSPTGLKIIQ
jgi:hypothetical protein